MEAGTVTLVLKNDFFVLVSKVPQIAITSILSLLATGSSVRALLMILLVLGSKATLGPIRKVAAFSVIP